MSCVVWLCGAWCGEGMVLFGVVWVRGMGAWCGAVAVRDQVVCGRLSLHRSRCGRRTALWEQCIVEEGKPELGG